MVESEHARFFGGVELFPVAAEGELADGRDEVGEVGGHWVAFPGVGSFASFSGKQYSILVPVTLIVPALVSFATIEPILFDGAARFDRLKICCCNALTVPGLLCG